MLPQRKILVTSALPYANGAIHLGHLLEHIQTDIWVRFQKMRAHECYYVCADDTHGTAVMLAAQKQNLTPEVLIQRVQVEHQKDFEGFLVSYDNYYSTHSAENQQFSELIYQALKKNHYIASRTISQLFDPIHQLFLPDRFVKGTCPVCGALDQYGDNCEICGATYASQELKDPYSVISKSKPILKESEHFFFKLSACADFLRKWTAGTLIRKDGSKQAHLQPESLNKLNEWIHQGLMDWDISRDAPYFGFEIPEAPGKYFYVWLDAPIGYLASFQDLCARLALNFDEWFSSDSSTELYHFIGKDILYFHALFWPAVLASSGFRTPSGVFAHGFLTIDGKKMSKSRGTYITAKSYLDQGLDPEWMRYYMAAKLNAHVEDIDWSFNDFVLRVNSDLIGKFINIASRTAKLLQQHFHNQLASQITDTTLLSALQDQSENIAQAYENREYSQAMRKIMALADQVNLYISTCQPWRLAKELTQHAKLHETCTILINAFRILSIYLKPVLPKSIVEIESFLNCSPLTWQDTKNLLPPEHIISPYQHLMQRVNFSQLEQLIKVD